MIEIIWSTNRNTYSMELTGIIQIMPMAHSELIHLSEPKNPAGDDYYYHFQSPLSCATSSIQMSHQSPHLLLHSWFANAIALTLLSSRSQLVLMITNKIPGIRNGQ